MKKSKYILAGLVALLTISVALLSGCKQNTSFEPILDVQQELQNIPAGELNFIMMSYTADNFALKKTVTVEEYIKANKGGELELTHNWIDDGDDDYGDEQGEDAGDYDDDLKLDSESQVSVKLKIEKRALDKNTTLSMSLDDQILSVTFGPHGTVFSSPALLTIKAKGLDLSGVDKKTIAIYYENIETGFWEPMKVEKINIKVKDGKLEIKNAQLPHFSRYAVAYGR